MERPPPVTSQHIIPPSPSQLEHDESITISRRASLATPPPEESQRDDSPSTTVEAKADIGGAASRGISNGKLAQTDDEIVSLMYLISIVH